MRDHDFGLVELLLVFGIVIALALWDWRVTVRSMRETAPPPEDDPDARPPTE